MAVVIPPGFAQVTYSITRTGDPDPYSVVLGNVCPTTLDIQPLAEFHVETFESVLQDHMYVNQTLTTVTVTTATNSLEYPANVEGNAGNAPLPPNSALLVRKLSNLRGRANQGRNFWPGFVEQTNVNNLGIIDPVELNTLRDAFGNWFAAWALSDYDLVILHDESSPVTSPTSVAAIQVEAMIATQRRRLRS